MIRDRTREILEKYGLELSKKEGQSHLVDREILERIVSYANVSGLDKILEIGPGIGNLTGFLLEKAEKVIAVEKDKRLVEVLRVRFSNNDSLEIVQGDILKVEFPSFDKVVANLPYSISSPVTFRILRHDFELAVLMYQREFAERMIASPGSSQYSRLSVNVSYCARAELLEEVTPDKFIPIPKVSSAIVKLEPREPEFNVKEEKFFYRTVKAVFQHRRKKVRNGLIYSFKEIFPESKLSDNQKRSLIDDKIPKKLLNKRPERLKPKEFGKIANILHENRDLVN